MATKKLEFEAEMAEGRVIRGGEDWIIFNLEGFRAVLSGVWEVFGSGTYTILLMAGQHMGRRLAEYLEGKGFKSEMALVEGFVGFITETGWGKTVAENATSKGLTVKVYNYALYRGEKGRWRSCALIKGVILGFFSTIWGKASCLETRCILDEDECCEFKVEKGRT
jgi:predicted hydrocarbon binding protein